MTILLGPYCVDLCLMHVRHTQKGQLTITSASNVTPPKNDLLCTKIGGIQGLQFLACILSIMSKTVLIKLTTKRILERLGIQTSSLFVEILIGLYS